MLGLQPAQRVLANSPRMGTRAVPAVLMQLAPRSKGGMGHDNAGAKLGGGDGSRAILRIIAGAALHPLSIPAPAALSLYLSLSLSLSFSLSLSLSLSLSIYIYIYISL